MPSVTHQGGPVINSPQLWNVFVGDYWKTVAGTQRRQRLDLFTEDILNSSYMSTLAQYGCTDPGAFKGSAIISNVDRDLQDKEIQGLIQLAINQGAIPEPTPNTIVMCYLSDETGVSDPGLDIYMCGAGKPNNAFGYHYFFRTKGGNSCYYSVMPGLSDQCLKNTCLSDTGCSLKLSQTQEQRITQVASHELCEVITDPEVSTWYDLESRVEGADICNGISVKFNGGSGNEWTVQANYSKNDDLTNGEPCRADTALTSPADKGAALQSELLRNQYNYIGGIVALLIAAVVGSRRGPFTALSLGVVGFVAGYFLTDTARKNKWIQKPQWL